MSDATKRFVDIMQALTATPVKRGGLRWGDRFDGPVDLYVTPPCPPQNQPPNGGVGIPEKTITINIKEKTDDN